jgi:hypothetical protein
MVTPTAAGQITISASASGLSTAAIFNETTVFTIGGVEAQVLFAGLAPGFVGLYRSNARAAAGFRHMDNCRRSVFRQQRRPAITLELFQSFYRPTLWGGPLARSRLPGGSSVRRPVAGRTNNLWLQPAFGRFVAHQQEPPARRLQTGSVFEVQIYRNSEPTL